MSEHAQATMDSAPESPSSPSDQQQRTQTCAICKISTNSYHLNYGVSSCLSCRAFFRRIIQQKMKTQMKCKSPNSEGCVITPETRKKCKKCRFDACIRAGMKTDAVMSEDQYKTWFRRMLRKKKKETKSSNPGPKESIDCGFSSTAQSPHSDTMNYECMDENSGSPKSYGSWKSDEMELDYMMAHFSAKEARPLDFSPEVGPTKEDDFNLIRVCPSFFPEYVVEDVKVPILTVDKTYVASKDESSEDKFSKVWDYFYNQCQQSSKEPTQQPTWEQTCLEVIRNGRTRWNKACSKARVPISEFSHKLYKMHRANQSFTTTMLLSHLDTLSSLFNYYANLFPEFRRLSANDQRQLLEHNTKLFVQYFLGRYFYGGSGFKQTQWLLLCQVPDFLNESTYLRFIPITTFNGMVHLFKSEEALKQYEEYGKSLNQMVLGVECNCAVALLCLFASNDKMTLDDRDAIQQKQEIIFKVSGFGATHFNCAEPNTLRTIVDLCSNMAANFDGCVAWGVNELLSLDQPVPAPLTFDFINKTFLESFDAYPFGEDLIKEYMLFRMGVPYSKSFLGRVWMVIGDRCRFVLRQTRVAFVAEHHDEGQTDDLARMCAEEEEYRVFRAVGLFASKMNTSSDAAAQLADALGGFDRAILQRQLAAIHNMDAVSNRSTTIQNFDFLSCITPEVLVQVDETNKHLLSFVSDSRLWHLLTLVLLFGIGDPCRGRLKPLLPPEVEHEVLAAIDAHAHKQSDTLERFRKNMDSVDYLASVVKVVIQNMG